ncbi:serpin family protein [Glycomyces sp. YM15]|uniref:serpin family protein n=1 Tax=Glycomyces sp. YM15 TaxID=2800446 RepID=UPI0019647F0F|nr:serpin family protein [Glycomyces sp. YM15]
MGTETTIQDALTASEIKAANELTRRWFASRESIPAVASGLGIWPLLAALVTGAVHETRNELLAATGLDADQAAKMPAALLEAVRATPSIRLALALWAGARVTLDPEWIAGLPVEAVGSLTGDAAADKAVLDAWASRNTGGLIERMPLDFSRPIDLVLASALSIRTTWRTPFEDSSRAFNQGPWAGLGRCRVLTATLNDDVLRVADNASVLTVPGDGDIDVLLALGRDGLAPQAVMNVLIDAATDPVWGRSSNGLSPGERATGVEVTEYQSMRPQAGPEVEVQTVRFKLDADLDLSDDADALGLVTASDADRARFDRLAAEPVYVTQAKQTAMSVFSATGFEAAAVTAIAMTRAAAFAKPKHRHIRASIRFDRPFAYLARHRPSGLILIAGWVDEPELD